MRGAGRGRRVLLAGLLGVGCASAITAVEGGYRNRALDFRIAAPAGPGPAWERVDVDEAALSFERGAPGRRDSLSLLSRCGRPVARAELMARHLVIGLEERHVLVAGPVGVAGRSGWTQTFDTVRQGVPVRIKTLTLVVGDCTFDWILAAAGPFSPAEAAFDAWWASFRLGSRYADEASQ